MDEHDEATGGRPTSAPPATNAPDLELAPLARTTRTQLRRKPQRGSYDRALAYAILDEGLVAHVGFVVGEQPFVIPMVYARLGDTLYLHGSPASRMLRNLAEGVPCAVTVTLVDGLVFARSAMHHSMNYRSLVILGCAREITDPATKASAFDALVEHVSPGRSRTARPANPAETRGTCVLALPLEEASVKQRTGGPVDLEEDLALPVWAGVVPLRVAWGEPQQDGGQAPSLTVPHAPAWARTGPAR